MTNWVATPEQVVELHHGKGATVVTGPVRIAFTSSTHAYVSTQAHRSDDAPAVTVRGKDYLISLHFVRHADGTWNEHPDNQRHNVSPRGTMDYWAAAAPTIRAAIVAALTDKVTKAATGGTLREAAYANAAQSLRRLEPERAALAAKLAELDAEIAQYQVILTSNAPQVQHAG